MRVMWIRTAAIIGALGVVLGAFGAHGLRDRVDPAQLAAWKTAVDYHLLHAIVLLALGLYTNAVGRPLGMSPWLFAGGIALFSGSIYCLVLTPWRWLGPVTPIGGVLLIAGWLSLLLLARPE